MHMIALCPLQIYCSLVSNYENKALEYLPWEMGRENLFSHQ